MVEKVVESLKSFVDFNPFCDANSSRVKPTHLKILSDLVDALARFEEKNVSRSDFDMSFVMMRNACDADLKCKLAKCKLAFVGYKKSSNPSLNDLIDFLRNV